MSDQEKEAAGSRPGITHLTNCPKCGTANPPETRYCVRCGASLAVADSRGDEGEAPEQKKRGLLARLFGR